MISINYYCKCGNDVIASVGESLQKNKLRWYISYQCTICGNAMEIDGIDEIPLEIKDAIIAEEGLWKLIIKDNAELVKTLFILKKQLKLTKDEITTIKSNTGNVLMQDTKCAIRRIYNILKEGGITGIEIVRN